MAPEDEADEPTPEGDAVSPDDPGAAEAKRSARRSADRVDPFALAKQEFARRLRSQILQRDWNQSDLARAAGLTRDSVSSYLRGLVLPQPLSLDRLAKALGVTPDYLLPEVAVAAVDLENPAFDLKVSASQPDQAWLRINRQVSFATAARISEMLAAEDKKKR